LEEGFFDKDPKIKMKWREAIAKKLNIVEKCNVWTVMYNDELPKGRNVLETNGKGMVPLEQAW
jgi:hypothetical protein